jgi:hypothetical protein
LAEQSLRSGKVVKVFRLSNAAERKDRMKTAGLFMLLTSFAVHCMAVDGFQDTPGKHLDILSKGRPLVRYMYGFDPSTPGTARETYKVYHHVMDESGTDTITKGAGHKYTHHRGIFIGWSKLKHNGRSSDLWHMKDGAVQKHVKVLEQKADGKKSTLSTQVDWLMAGGETRCIEEIRTVTVHHTDGKAHLLLDFETELKAVGGDVKLDGDPEHAGFQYRPHQDVVKNKSAKYTFHEDGVSPKKEKDLPWVAETYELRGRKYTVQHMNHPDNPKGSVYSAYRDYGRFGCYAKADIKSGESLKLRYRLRITAGEAPSREIMARQYDAFVR